MTPGDLLIDAAKKGNAVGIIKALSDGADVTKQDEVMIWREENACCEMCGCVGLDISIYIVC
jgi:hypothetical protein